jgi:hypothetical protein
VVLMLLWSRQESNLDPGLRRPLYYPLYYRTIDLPFIGDGKAT